MKIEIKDGLYLWSQDELIEEQKTWDEEDLEKNKDFTQAPYWLEASPNGTKPLCSIEDIVSVLEEFFTSE